MKKLALVLSLVLLMGALAACGNEAPETTVPSTTTPVETTPVETTLPTESLPEEVLPELSETETLLNKMYENVTVELPLAVMPVDLADEFALTTYTGATSAEGMVEAAFSESMIGSQAYSVTLVKCADADTAAAVAQTMFDNIDTAKWVCVQADQKMAAHTGEYAFFVMIDGMLAGDMGITIESVVDGFAAAVGSELTVIK